MNLEFIKPQNVGSLLMKSSQSNFNLRSPSSYLAHSYLIATVINSKSLPCIYFVSEWGKNYLNQHLHVHGKLTFLVCILVEWEGVLETSLFEPLSWVFVLLVKKLDKTSYRISSYSPPSNNTRISYNACTRHTFM